MMNLKYITVFLLSLNFLLGGGISAKDAPEKNDLKEKFPDTVNQLKKMLTEWQGALPAKPTGNVFSNLRKK